jgi:hypothetical protein
MTNSHAPKISAAVLRAAASRLFGAVVLDLADSLVGPAVYLPRLAAFASLEGEELGEDDGSLIVLVAPGEAMDLLAEHKSAAAAAAVVNARLRAEWAA